MHCNSFGGWTKITYAQKSHLKECQWPSSLPFRRGNPQTRSHFLRERVHWKVSSTAQRYFPSPARSPARSRSRCRAYSFCCIRKRATVLQRGSPLSRRSDGQCLERENRTVAQRRVWECSPNHSKLLRYLMDEIAAVLARTRVSSWFKRDKLFIPSPLRGKGREEKRESFFILWRCD